MAESTPRKKPNSSKADKDKIAIAEQLIDLKKQFSARLSIVISGKFTLKKNDKVEFIYNPLEYASELHNKFVRKYCTSPKKVLFLGMNPGPWGMCQTGVPFGEINAVKEYLKITGDVGTPANVHPARKIEGLNCKRSEVSGKRLWELIKNLTNGDPFLFFKECFVYNYCPVALLGKSGVNITPADLKSADQLTLNSVCDEFLYKVLRLLKIEIVVAIGKFVEKRAFEVLKAYDVKDIEVRTILHPSPRSKGSNNWHANTTERLKEFDLIQYMQ